CGVAGGSQRQPGGVTGPRAFSRLDRTTISWRLKSMFSKDSEADESVSAAGAASAAPRQGAASPGQSVISRDVKIKGDLTCSGDIQIDGAVEGDVQSRSITIGEGADIRGAITGDSVRVCGSVNGQIQGKSVVLAKTAKVNGDVTHQTLAIEPGAYFEGRCSQMGGS